MGRNGGWLVRGGPRAGQSSHLDGWMDLLKGPELAADGERRQTTGPFLFTGTPSSTLKHNRSTTHRDLLETRARAWKGIGLRTNGKPFFPYIDELSVGNGVYRSSSMQGHFPSGRAFLLSMFLHNGVAQR